MELEVLQEPINSWGKTSLEVRGRGGFNHRGVGEGWREINGPVIKFNANIDAHKAASQEAA